MEWTGLPLLVFVMMFSWLWLDHVLQANPDARRLYDDLLRKNKYNRLIRPIGNSSEKLFILVSLKLSQIIDVVSSPVEIPLCWRYIIAESV